LVAQQKKLPNAGIIALLSSKKKGAGEGRSGMHFIVGAEGATSLDEGRQRKGKKNYSTSVRTSLSGREEKSPIFLAPKKGGKKK